MPGARWSKAPGPTGIPPRSLVQPRTAPSGAAPQAAPRHRLESPSTAVQAPSTPAGPRHTRQPRGRRHCPGTGGLSMGHGHTGAGDTVGPQARAPLAPQRRRFGTSRGREAAPVWCNPRRRSETGRYPRAELEAGTRRRQVRWHQPTDISRINRPIDWLQRFRRTTSPRGHHHEERGLRISTPALDIGSHINERTSSPAPLGVRCSAWFGGTGWRTSCAAATSGRRPQ
jgi:hypothetical protein